MNTEKLKEMRTYYADQVILYRARIAEYKDLLKDTEIQLQRFLGALDAIKTIEKQLTNGAEESVSEK